MFIARGPAREPVPKQKNLLKFCPVPPPTSLSLPVLRPSLPWPLQRHRCGAAWPPPGLASGEAGRFRCTESNTLVVTNGSSQIESRREVLHTVGGQNPCQSAGVASWSSFRRASSIPTGAPPCRAGGWPPRAFSYVSRRRAATWEGKGTRLAGNMHAHNGRTELGQTAATHSQRKARALTPR